MLHLVGFGRAVVRSVRHDRGATMVEYGLLVVLIAVVVVPALIVLGPAVAAWYTGVIGNL
ncbi:MULTISPECIES: Flp family type IVb pilin [unclassified Kribbella]|jgi:pilus assembly protein Flp/PilA|uniref:Flp family type IVb pilin n=1 Tax=unclassified Kribbella TaxID=2644121 RepID=UPI003019D6B0